MQCLSNSCRCLALLNTSQKGQEIQEQGRYRDQIHAVRIRFTYFLQACIIMII